MKITSIETFPVRIPLKPERRMVSALGRHEVSNYVIVRLRTDTGLEGAGEAAVMPRWSGETVWGTQALIDHLLAPALLGMDVEDLPAIDRTMDQITQGNWFTKSAIEMACWDVLGKAAGRPVYELLGGAVRPLSLRCRFSMGAYPPDRARARAKELVEEGFTTIKVKVGGVVEEDVERVRVVREAIGPQPELVIDANCGYDAPTAIRVARQLESCRVALFEQPTPRGDYGALAEVRRSVDCQVMADDTVFDFSDARECIRNRACDVISVYPGKNGGIRKARRIVDYAAEHDVACSIGSNLEFDIASAAMCHLCVACPNMQIETYPGDILGPAYHEVSLVKDPLPISGPIITLHDRPGLGIEVDWETVERHRLRW